MNALVSLSDGAAVTTSLVIAEGTEVEHRAVIQLVRNNLSDFEEFGGVAFEMRPFSTAGGTQERTVAILNEQHATLLMTYMRNSDIVREFKKRLVRAFYELAQGPSFDPASLSRQEILRLALNAEEERLALETKNQELTPKAEAYDEFLDATGKYGVGAVAKMLGSSQNKLFRDLRNAGVLIAKGPMRNTPYQKYMHHFEVKAHTYERSSGEQGTSYTTYVQPSGIDFIRRKLGLLAIDPVPASTKDVA